MLNLIFLAIIGAAGGYIATRIMGLDLPLIPTIAIGVVGAIIGGFVLSAVLSILGILGSLIGAVLGAMALIYGYQALNKG